MDDKTLSDNIAPAFDLDRDFGPRVATAPAPEVTVTPSVPQQYTREIDLGDGSGVQRFVGNSPDELIDKLTEAQRNATLKIRELSTRREPEPPPQDYEEPVARPTLTPEQMAEQAFLLQQQLQSDPVSAVDTLLYMRTGMTSEDLERRLSSAEHVEQAIVITQSTQNFLDNHPEFPQNQHNSDMISNYLEKYGLPWTEANLELAYSRVGGLLISTPSEPAVVQPVNTSPFPTVLSSRGSVPQAADVDSGKAAAEAWLRDPKRTSEEIMAYIQKQTGR